MKPDDLLPFVRRPARYLGNEVNSRCRDWGEAALRSCLIFPDLYEIGMSHLGLHILYDLINKIPWALADRAYCPDTDLEKLMVSSGTPLWGLETRRPIADFDILAVTLPYELCYSNILTILSLGGIPVRACERKDSDRPVILGGGSCSVNPEPVADFFDAILVGDGEEAVPEILAVVRDWRQAAAGKDELLEFLSGIHGVYVPGFYRPRYTKNGAFEAIEPLKHDLAATVHRRIISDLEHAVFPEKPLVPAVRIVHDRAGIEIARGCTRGCRFCQAGTAYRPVRERRPGTVYSLVRSVLEETGWEEISLLSLSTGDYCSIQSLLEILIENLMPEKISVSLPSLRVGTLTPDMIRQIRRIRKTGFTMAPEAGSERLRQVINKGIAEEDLLSSASLIYRHGWSNIKLYFMIGLPTETEDDVLAIAGLAGKVLETSRTAGTRRKKQVTVSVGTFVPKPHTPFQWEGQISLDESREKIGLLKSRLNRRGIRFKWHDPEHSFLEGVFSRGDRRLSRVLCRAWQAGARLDAWTDHLETGLYHAAACEEGIDLDSYLLSREPGSPLPWRHISTGMTEKFLLKERKKSFERTYTPDCRYGDCGGCGVCDFSKIRPRIHEKLEISRTSPAQGRAEEPPAPGTKPPPVFHYHLSYTKLGDARFVGHLDMVHIFHRAARRSGLPVAYSKGYHPLPRFSFAQPLPLGTESLAEHLVCTLTRHMKPADLMDSINRELPEGIRITAAEIVSGKKKRLGPADKCRYLIFVPDLSCSQAEAAIQALTAAKDWPVTRSRKTGETTVDLKAGLDSIILKDPDRSGDGTGSGCWIKSTVSAAGGQNGTTVELTLNPRSGSYLKPVEVISSVFSLGETAAAKTRILKTEEWFTE